MKISVYAAVLPPPAETTDASTTKDAVSNAQVYSELNKVRIVGIALVVLLLTAALMSSVFLGMRRKDDVNEPPTPQEEYEDFG